MTAMLSPTESVLGRTLSPLSAAIFLPPLRWGFLFLKTLEKLIVALFLIDFLKRLQALLALGMEDHATLFQCFALLTLTGLLILGN